MRVLVCIPTLTGREPYLANAVWSYKHHAQAHAASHIAQVDVSIVRDAPTAGEGWNKCLAQVALENYDYIHFSNDDIVVARGWLEPLIEAADLKLIGGPRIEPAGVHAGEFPLHEPPMISMRHRSPYGYFYSDVNQPKRDFALIDHSALPFVSARQLHDIGEFPPIHFGSDKWLAHNAREAGYPTVARQTSIVYNYAPQIGRERGGWTELDFIDFDLNIAYPLYQSGALKLNERHPDRETPEGLQAVRKWREENLR